MRFMRNKRLIDKIPIKDSIKITGVQTNQRSCGAVELWPSGKASFP